MQERRSTRHHFESALLPVLVILLCSSISAGLLIAVLSQIPGISPLEGGIGVVGAIAALAVMRITLEG